MFRVVAPELHTLINFYFTSLPHYYLLSNYSNVYIKHIVCISNSEKWKRGNHS